MSTIESKIAVRQDTEAVPTTLLGKLEAFIESEQYLKLGTHSIEIKATIPGIWTASGASAAPEHVKLNVIRKKARDAGLEVRIDATYGRSKTTVYINIISRKK